MTLQGSLVPDVSRKSAPARQVWTQPQDRAVVSAGKREQVTRAAGAKGVDLGQCVSLLWVEVFPENKLNQKHSSGLL